MELSVKTLDSQTHIFRDLDEEITVQMFKSHISPTVALPPEQQRLIFRGRVLQDDKKMKEYNVSSGQVIHLVARNPTTTSSANDHPPPQPNRSGAGRGNAIIMGAFGTVEFPTQDRNNLGAGSAGQAIPRRNSAAVRLNVANRTLTRASDLLRTLEEDITLLQAQNQRAESDEEEDDSRMVMLGRQHAATGTTLVASIEEHVVSAAGVVNGRADEPETAGNILSGNQPPAATTEAPITPRIRAPVPRELGTAITDLIDINTRLTPYLQTLQRWLTENRELSDAHLSVQYTFNSVSSILHSVAHAVHALSDITVDFSLPPGQRRLRAPSTVWIEQSPILRATIPIGVHVGVGLDHHHHHNADAAPTDSEEAQNATNNATPSEPNGQAQGGQAQPVALQQAIGNLLQGFVGRGQAQAQQPQQQPVSATSNQGGTTAAMGNAFVESILQLAQGQMNQMRGQPGRQPASAPNQNQANNSNTPAQAQQQPRRAAQQEHSNSFFDQMQEHGQSPPRLESLLLQCQSHHYATSSVIPPRPENLRSFLSHEVDIAVGPESHVFETFASILQGLNAVHPILNQYIRGNILRGRDVNNPGHVTTGVRLYARRLVEWIVNSITATEDIDASALASRLHEVLTSFMSKVTQVVLTASPDAAITPTLAVLLNEFMPEFLSALEATFPSPDHLRIFKGIILLIVTACFPDTSLVFDTQLTTGIAEYLINSEPQAHHETDEHEDDHHEEMSMEIEMEFGDITDNVEIRNTPARQPEPQNPVITNVESMATPASNVTHVSATPSSDSDSDQDLDAEYNNMAQDLDTEYNNMTSDLFRDIPQDWHSVVLNDIQRQAPLTEPGYNRPPFSAGFLSLFPQKK